VADDAELDWQASGGELALDARQQGNVFFD
jgi:hypothetical protein